MTQPLPSQTANIPLMYIYCRHSKGRHTHGPAVQPIADDKSSRRQLDHSLLAGNDKSQRGEDEGWDALSRADGRARAYAL